MTEFSLGNIQKANQRTGMSTSDQLLATKRREMSKLAYMSMSIKKWSAAKGTGRLTCRRQTKRQTNILRTGSLTVTHPSAQSWWAAGERGRWGKILCSWQADVTSITASWLWKRFRRTLWRKSEVEHLKNKRPLLHSILLNICVKICQNQYHWVMDMDTVTLTPNPPLGDSTSTYAAELADTDVVIYWWQLMCCMFMFYMN